MATPLLSGSRRCHQGRWIEVLYVCCYGTPEHEYQLQRETYSIKIVTKVYDLIKIHKQNLPLRFMMSVIGCPTYNSSKFLSEILKHLLDFDNEKILSKYYVHQFLFISYELNRINHKTENNLLISNCFYFGFSFFTVQN